MCLVCGRSRRVVLSVGSGPWQQPEEPIDCTVKLLTHLLKKITLCVCKRSVPGSVLWKKSQKPYPHERPRLVELKLKVVLCTLHKKKS